MNRVSGHRLLCSDGAIRAAELAMCPDTFFSTPARVRVRGKWLSGYMTVLSRDEVSTDLDLATFVFRQHTNGKHASLLPPWPIYDLEPDHLSVSARYDAKNAKINALLALAHT